MVRDPGARWFASRQFAEISARRTVAAVARISSAVSTFVHAYDLKHPSLDPFQFQVFEVVITVTHLGHGYAGYPAIPVGLEQDVSVGLE